VLIEKNLQLPLAQAKLIEEDHSVERYDRPDDDWFVRAADVVAQREQ